MATTKLVLPPVLDMVLLSVYSFTPVPENESRNEFKEKNRNTIKALFVHCTYTQRQQFLTLFSQCKQVYWLFCCIAEFQVFPVKYGVVIPETYANASCQNRGKKDKLVLVSSLRTF